MWRMPPFFPGLEQSMLRNLFSTVTKKVVTGFLMIVLFSVCAVGYALTSMHQQTQWTEQLVNVDFRTFELVRDLRENLLAQENIEKQLLILRDPDLSRLRLNRNAEYARLSLALDLSEPTAQLESLVELIEQYRLADGQLSELLYRDDWEQAGQLSNDVLVPMRDHLLNFLADFRQQQQQRINTGLEELSARTSHAYRMTALLTLIGICLSAPVSLAVIFSVHRSVKTLKRATRKISAGRFEHKPELSGDDEFSQLAKDFQRMGEKLRDLDQLRLDANPLTQLPGNLAIDREVDRRIAENEPFAHLYIDLDNFKAYSDRYGYNSGSDVLARVGDLIKKVVIAQGACDDLVGHIGGDDYVVVTTIDLCETLAAAIIEAFSSAVPFFYDASDREAGSFVGKDRFGVERTFSLMTISVAIILSTNQQYPSRLAISQECARLKEYLKIQPGSNYMIGQKKS
jgi:GGDEF domain-containing protein